MIFMWIRVLGSKGPEGVEAALLSVGSNTAAVQKTAAKITFRQLPVVQGRNDILSRNFFDGTGFADILEGRSSSVKEDKSSSKNDNERSISHLAGKLNLVAICGGSNPQAFINDKLVASGDKLIVEDGNKTFECEVAEITEHEVKVVYLESAIMLKLPQIAEQGR
jgi:hypothetical protein